MTQKSSHQFMTKMLSYQGLLVTLPYIIIHMLELANNPISEQDSTGFIIFMIVMLFVVILFDFLGLRSNFLDIHSRQIMTILCFLAAVFLGILEYFTYSLWDNSNAFLLFLIGAITSCYLLIGWFYIRSEKTNRPSKGDRPLLSTSKCFAISGLTWMFGYLFGDGIILIAIIISLLSYPFVMIVRDNRFNEDPGNIIPPEQLAVREDLVAITDFVWDIIKVVLIIVTIIVLSYNGEMVLFPTSGISDPTIIWRNLMWLSFSSSLVSAVYHALEDLVYGKLIVTIVLISSCIQPIFEALGYKDQWLMITVLNGATLSGVFVFIEQKIAKSGNVRVLPGLMFYLIFMMQLSALFLNDIGGVQPVMDILRFLIGLFGLVYVLFRIKIEQKEPDLKRKGVRYSPLGIKYDGLHDVEYSQHNL
mgnify:CR=1 FL=1